MERSKQDLVIQFLILELLKPVTDQLGTAIREEFFYRDFRKPLEEYGINLRENKREFWRELLPKYLEPIDREQ